MNNEITKMTQEILLKRKVPISWSFILVFVGPLLAATILTFLYIFDIVKPNSWINWVMLIIFIPLIFISQILTQRRGLVGAYGETILLLIPTFVWLLPGHNTSKATLIYMATIIIFLGLIIYLSSLIVAFLRETHDEKKQERRKQIVEILLRMGFISVSVTSTVIVSMIIINWGDFSLRLSEVTDIKGKIEIDYTNSRWITFITVITIIVALTLVTIGLVSSAKERYKNSYIDGKLGINPYKNKKSSKNKNSITSTTKSRSSKTTMINLRNKSKKR